MGLINKAALIAEIERLNEFWHLSKGADGQAFIETLLSFLDTLEMKDVVAEQEGICNGILNTIIGDTWHIKIPLNKAGLKHGDKVKIFITKEK